MPLVGHVRELSGMVVHEEFRDGNVSPGTGHVPFLKDCLRRLPDGVRVTPHIQHFSREVGGDF